MALTILCTSPRRSMILRFVNNNSYLKVSFNSYLKVSFNSYLKVSFNIPLLLCSLHQRLVDSSCLRSL